MVLEATMIVVDNSESSRNGDYLPDRFGAQAEAVNLIFNAKTGANPESSVGLMSMGGKGPEVLVTLTTDIGKILGGLHQTKIRGISHLSTGISIAALALKHRQNKSQRQRIIVFTCSSIHDSEKDLVKLARKMKKNNISIDFIAFGDLESDTKQKLEAFNENVNGGDGSHLALIPPGPNLLSDSIITTPILSSGDGAGPSGSGDGMDGVNGGGAGQNGGFEFGFNPETDPELAMALRMSMEEETNRLERQRKEQEEKDKAEGKAPLEGIPEEGGQANGEASTSAPAEDSKQPTVEDEKTDEKTDDDPDKMDTA